MLKRGVMLLFFILSISTFSMVTHAANSSEYVNQSFYGYKEPSFTSAKTNGGSEYGAQNVGVMEKRDNGWWKIETWEGPVWINLNGEERVMGDFYAYDEPSLSSKVANAGAKYGRQTFRIVDGTRDGWLKIKTWEGDKWMNPTAEQITVNKTIYAYNEPSFNATKANYGAPFNPQNWGVVEKKENGWMKVSTYEGYKWINPNGEERFINKSFYAYNEASFNAAKANAGALYSPQNFRVVDGTPSGWLKVKTWEGEKWLNLDGEERFIEKPFYAYNEPSFSSGKANAGALYNPQNFRIIDGTTSGWLKIKTWEGDKWVNLSAEATGIEFYVEATAYSVEGSPPHERITAFGIDIGKNPNIKLIAVDPKVIKLGTKVRVEGYGEAIAGDTGGAIKGNKIDVLFPTEKQAREWGRKKVKIEIIK
ncbi:MULTISPECIES: 3D domain-containing protein [Bacillus]|uniref:3D domain-containing protein n=1 Tax=Bacillus TaxID=1386 RepID=UPI0011A1052E|nr:MULTISPECIES: 3D domain-containing protein [Bacillus]MBK0075487.1 3D domain-containing protein [Bacillus sp. S56]